MCVCVCVIRWRWLISAQVTHGAGTWARCRWRPSGWRSRWWRRSCRRRGPADPPPEPPPCTAPWPRGPCRVTTWRWCLWDNETNRQQCVCLLRNVTRRSGRKKNRTSELWCLNQLVATAFTAVWAAVYVYVKSRYTPSPESLTLDIKGRSKEQSNTYSSTLKTFLIHTFAHDIKLPFSSMKLCHWLLGTV